HRVTRGTALRMRKHADRSLRSPSGRVAWRHAAPPARSQFMKMKPSPPKLIALFDDVVPGPPAERRKMFGYPAAFVNGHLFMGLFEDVLMLRLGEADRA